MAKERRTTRGAKEPTRARQRMRRNRWSSPDAEPLDVRGHHLMCAVCVRGGCRTPPPGMATIRRLLDAMWAYPYVQLRVLADVDVNRAHYLAEYEGRKGLPLPENLEQRRRDYVWRRKDLEVCRVLGILPNTVIPAFWVYTTLFQRQRTLDGICRTGSPPSDAWPECPHARSGCYEKIASEPLHSLEEQTALGEKLDGRGIWAMIRPRSRQDMRLAKERSARFIMEKAKRLYIRPQHLLCILCRPSKEKVLIEDNLIELLRRMEADPEIPVTLVEGCCMACDPCNEYHAGEHLCYHTHAKDSLRDLMILERLGLPPGATLPARELYRLIYERIGSLKEICGWRDGTNTAPWWAPCGYEKPYLDEARRTGLVVSSKKPAGARGD